MAQKYISHQKWLFFVDEGFTVKGTGLFLYSLILKYMKLKYLLLLLFISPLVFAGNPHKTSSVLATGSWYKIAVQETGIHKITYQDFIDMGISPSQLNSSAIGVFGNGGGMLPENNSGYRYDDLRENSIEVVDGGDGKIDEGDYILFYGESPDNWTFNYTTRVYSHAKNLYSDYSYYFITVSEGTGNRVTLQPSSISPASFYSTKFDDYAFHEIDSLNLIRSGRTWYGEVFNDKKDFHDFYFSFPNINIQSPVKIVTSVAARAPVLSKFFISEGSTFIDSLQADATDLQSISLFGRPKQKISWITNPDPDIHITMKYQLPDANSAGWLDYLELSCIRNLRWVAPQMSFRDANSVGKYTITEFVMSGADPSVVVWDITDQANIRNIQGTLTDSTLKFRLPTDTLREFIAFNGSSFYPVSLVEPVANQNLHSILPHDLVIVTNPLFAEQADSLAEFHRITSHLSVVVAKTTDIYNEFASGNPDPTAIRDFVKMLYDKGMPGNTPKYLLLFGDGSYDPKNRVPNNNNMVPTYQSLESLKYIGTFVTDDYYGIMGDNQGDGSNGDIDIGIGRFPVTLKSEASILLNKIIHYSSNKDSVQSDWRNMITFIADNENRNMHLNQAEELANIVKTKYPVYNVNKIYIDSYPFVPTPAGDRCPDANKAITKAVTKGCLILNYTGHGGEGGWAAEKILTSEDVGSWENINTLPVFITATCEFSRFDNPERYTAGEMVLMQPNGGAIAIYSTTRLALSTSNFRLDSSFFMNLLPKNGEPIPKMGDLIKISKNYNGNNNNIRNFVLLGDPAQSIAHPQYKITTTEINHKPVNSDPDTTQGLSTVDVKGRIEDLQGNMLKNFNGILFPKVFDKPTTYRTLANQEDSYQQNFELQNSLLYQGKATITNGEFDFSFVVPKSIALQFGKGKISYYAKDSITDANGFFDDFIIGGADPSVNFLNSGPEIALYMENPEFINGDKTNRNTELLAFLDDSNGINYTGLGIGHEIVAILDNDAIHPIVLNDYFNADIDQYGSGIVRYPINNLGNGRHTLRLRAWDLFNNSSEKEISFFVSDYPTLAVNQIGNYPNPFKDMTTFRFFPIQNAGNLVAQIQIFTLTGFLVRTIESEFKESDQGVLTIQWNGRGDQGQQLSSGLYIYHLKVTGENGAAFRASQKLVILDP